MNGKVVIITGASSGIGRALAKEFFSRGASLALGARRIDQLEVLKAELQSSNILCVATDVSNEMDCRNLIELTIEKFGRIDVLINNGGISMRSVFLDREMEVMH